MTSPHPYTILLARGTLARLALWPALRIAVHASWGGPASAEKQRWLAGVLVDQFEPFIAPPTSASTLTSTSASTSTSPLAGTDPPDDIYIEDLLLQIMTDEFDAALEDDSAAAVARDLVRLFEAVHQGDETLVRALEAQADKIRGTVPKYEWGGSESGSESEWEDEDEDESEGEPVPQLLTRKEPQVDEDGFTMVTKRGRQ